METIKERVKQKLAEIETDPKFGHQVWYDEDVANLLYDILDGDIS